MTRGIIMRKKQEPISKLSSKIRLQQIAILTLLAVTIIAILFAVNQHNTINDNDNDNIIKSTSSIDTSKINALTIIRDGETNAKIPDHIRGAKASRVVAFEYGDPSGEHTCESYNPINKELYNEYSNSVTFVYRNFSLSYPLSTKLMRAMEAAYIANGENAYWGMFDRIANDCNIWSSPDSKIDDVSADNKLLSYVTELGLNTSKWREAVENSEKNGIDEKIKRDKEWGISLGITGVPTWLINGKTINNITYDILSTELTKKIK